MNQNLNLFTNSRPSRSDVPEAQTPLRLTILSLRFKHEEFCDELYTRRNTLSLTIFVGSQAAFLTAG
jgi:hypothetical protein